MILWSVGWLYTCSYSHKTKIRETKMLLYKNHTTGWRALGILTNMQVSCRDLTCLDSVTLRKGHVIAKYQKYMSLNGEILKLQLLNIPGFCKTQGRALKSTNENVQWHKKDAYYFEIYFYLSFFSFLDNRLQWQHQLEHCNTLIPQHAKFWQLN